MGKAPHKVVYIRGKKHKVKHKSKKRGEYDLDEDGWYSASKLEIFNLK